MYMYVSNKIDIYNLIQLIYIFKCIDIEMYIFIYYKKRLEFCWCWFLVYMVNYLKIGLYWIDFKCIYSFLNWLLRLIQYCVNILGYME